MTKSFNESVTAVKAALQEEGFGILSEIDVQAKMKQKLNKDMRPYLILGACHPPSAYKAINLETEIGLYLPCNVIIYEDEANVVHVGAVKPSSAMSMFGNPELNELAKNVESMLERVISKV